MRWSVEEYEQLAEQGVIPKNAELLRGLVIEKMPKSPLHRALSKRLHDLIQRALPPGFVVFQEAPVRLADSEPEPDVSLVRGTESDFLKAHPTTASLVIEVAVSSASLDRANASIYAQAGIPEYWIVLGHERQVEVYRLASEGGYGERQVVGLGDALLLPAGENNRLPVTDIFS